MSSHSNFAVQVFNLWHNRWRFFKLFQRWSCASSKDSCVTYICEYAECTSGSL